ncbi:hypothetical protein [Tenacibaculum soleae]|uniref:hypothetical protein n=1 Tax=Tenacibaculum soleae TaxID=447689 RepID=UPI00230106A8|nr:hypothetical protein [Tenacibaculum soleae]
MDIKIVKYLLHLYHFPFLGEEINEKEFALILNYEKKKDRIFRSAEDEAEKIRVLSQPVFVFNVYKNGKMILEKASISEVNNLVKQ